MRILDGNELQGYIKERQARQVRALRQAKHTFPKLAIIQTTADPVIATYVRLKKAYGDDILVEVVVHTPDSSDVGQLIKRLNEDVSVHGIIVQLPLAEGLDTDAILNAIAPAKDVDGLGDRATLIPATPQAIDWLLAGYNVELRGKRIAIVGDGRLVGHPLGLLWRRAGLEVSIYDDTTHDLAANLRQAQIIVSATGVPGLITANMVQAGAVVVDAGTASENGKIVGDIAADVRERTDVTLTPTKGGVGPLTIAALFDNVIQAAQAAAAQRE